ncbi:hypothetical protein K3495_g5386 [Podosphaera aphanis]|nr:hypothetical protein K3495_g5386 [Podosphaera aphanis]
MEWLSRLSPDCLCAYMDGSGAVESRSAWGFTVYFDGTAINLELSNSGSLTGAKVYDAEIHCAMAALEAITTNLRNHHISTIYECYLFNPKARPKTWANRRSFASKQRLFNLATEPEKRKQLEKELGHRLPREILELPAQESSSAVETSNYENLYDDNYITESQTSYDRSEPELSYMLALTTSQTSLPYKDWWVFDSGSGRHICNNRDSFHILKPLKTHQIIKTGRGDCQVEGVGTMVLQVTTLNGQGELKIEGVLFVPDFMVNIVSMDRIKDQMLIWDHSENWLTHWNSSRTPVVKIWNQYNQKFIAKKAIHPYQTKLVTDIPESISIDLILQNSSYATKVSTMRKISSSDVVIWHHRLGHPEPNTIKKLHDSVVGAKITGSYDGICEGCLLAKSKRIVSRIPADKEKDYSNRMHVDLIVFSNAWNGDNYAIHAYNAKGRGHMVDTIPTKDQLTLCRSVSNMISQLRTKGRNIEYLHSDNEKGFGNKFKQILKDIGIKFEPTVPYTPEQNGFAESTGNCICVVARALRIHSGFPDELWPELVHTAVYLLNRTPNRGLNWLTPFEKYRGIKPDISNLKIIGCRAFVHIPRQKRLASEKLAERAWIGYLIGFEAHTIWRIWHPKSREVVRVRDVVFQEDHLYPDDRKKSENPIEIDQFPSLPGPSIDNIINNPLLNRWNLI